MVSKVLNVCSRSARSTRRRVRQLGPWVAVSVGSICLALAQYPSARHGGNYMHNYYLPPAPSSTPWAPCWSPDGRWIAVAMNGSIWKVDPSTGVAWELTDGKKYHSSPSWSPDGKWILYTADDDAQTIQLEIVNLETGEIGPLTDDQYLYTEPSFSPDGSQVVYVSTRPKGHFNVWVRPIRDGHWTGPALAVTKDRSFGRDRLYFGPWDMHINPGWFPGGRELLLVSNRGVALGSGNVWRLPALENGMGQARVVLSEQTLYRTAPDVSPDGKRFVYSSTGGAADQFSNLYLQPTAGGDPYKLTFFQHDAFAPRWSPDGEWIAYIDNRDGLPQLAVLETHGGENRIVRIRDRRWKRPMGLLSVRIVEAATGQPTACRIHLTAEDGKFYAPAGAYARVSRAGDHVFHTDGSFTLELPAGSVHLEAVKGFEFQPQEFQTRIEPGQLSQIRIELEQVTDMAARGWFSGSTHVHMNYGGNLHNSLQNLMLMSAAEDQDVVNELVANKDNRVLDYQFFVSGGKPHPLSTPERLLQVGQEYRPPFYGHVFLLGLKSHLISPATTGYEGTAIESLYPSNTDILRKAKAQGATVGYVHAFGGEEDPLKGNLGGGKGYMVDAALGTVDAVEWSGAGRAGFYPWYATLNNGLRVVAVGGEDSISDLHRSKLIGSVRTYVHTGEEGLSLTDWMAGLRQGHSFVSTGPLVQLTVEGRMPGEEVQLPAAGGEVKIEATIESITPLRTVLLVFNGEILEDISVAGKKRIRLQKLFRISRSGWFHLRAEGAPVDRYPLDCDYAQAFTNPVWIRVGDRPVRSRAAAEYSIQWISKLRSMAESWPGWRSERERVHVLKQFEEARHVYEKFAREAGPLE
ncbi:MAG: CehA/McbA family metallohydrolase [Acidobacteriota bacterium]